MNKTTYFIVVVFMVLALVGCKNIDCVQPDITKADESLDTIDDSDNMVGTPSLEQIREKANSSDPWGHYKAILAFLTGDVETLVQCGAGSIDNELKGADYEFITTIKISSYEVSEQESGDIDFKFTVTESQSDIITPGAHHFLLGVTWCEVNEYNSNSEYEEILDLIEFFAGHGCTAWENGAPTYEDNGLGFDFSIIRTVQFFANSNNIPNYDGLTEEYVKVSAEKLFGIENYTPSSEYFTLVNGRWEQNQYVGIVNTVHTVTDIRTNGDVIEIDIQYFADKLSMVPSHKVTVYVTKSSDRVYEYCFEKAIVTESGVYKPIRWSV